MASWQRAAASWLREPSMRSWPSAARARARSLDGGSAGTAARACSSDALAPSLSPFIHW